MKFWPRLNAATVAILVSFLMAIFGVYAVWLRQNQLTVKHNLEEIRQSILENREAIGRVEFEIKRSRENLP